MSRFSASDAAFTGFHVLSAHRRAALIWAAGLFVFQIVFTTMIVMTMGPYMTQMQSPGVQKLDPAQATALLQHMAPVYLMLAVFFLAFYPIIIAAMNRVVLTPGDGRFAYLRVGKDELRILGVLLLFVLLAIGAEIVAVIAGVLIGVVLTLALKVPAGLVGVGVGVIVFCAWIFVAVRLSLAFSQTFAKQRVDLLGSWSLTRGQFWPMFGAYVLTFALMLVVYVVGYLAIFVLGLLFGGGFGGLVAMFRPAVTLAALLSPIRLIHLVFGALMLTVIWPLLLTPQPFIYGALTGRAEGLDVPPTGLDRPWQ